MEKIRVELIGETAIRLAQRDNKTPFQEHCREAERIVDAAIRKALEREIAYHLMD